jgi:hypothetical protein
MATESLKKHAIGAFHTREEAEQALQALLGAGFPKEQISVVTTDSEGEIAGVEVEDAEGNKAGKGAKAGATAGGVGGLAVGALEGLGYTTFASLLLPGAGQVIVFGTVAANVLATTVAGGAMGAVGGGIIGGLVGWGVPEARAKFYQDLVTKGEYLVMLEGTEEQMSQAESVLEPKGIREWEIYEAPKSEASR